MVKCKSTQTNEEVQLNGGRGLRWSSSVPYLSYSFPRCGATDTVGDQALGKSKWGMSPWQLHCTSE